MRVVVACAAVAVALPLLLGLLIELAHPRDRIVSGGRIWHCANVGGGSATIDDIGGMRFRDGLGFAGMGGVHDGDVLVVAVDVVERVGRRRVGSAVVVARGGERNGAVDQGAAEVVERLSPDGLGSHRRAAAAARERLNERVRGGG